MIIIPLKKLVIKDVRKIFSWIDILLSLDISILSVVIPFSVSFSTSAIYPQGKKRITLYCVQRIIVIWIWAQRQNPLFLTDFRTWKINSFFRLTLRKSSKNFVWTLFLVYNQEPVESYMKLKISF